MVPILFFNDSFGMDSKLGSKWTLNTAGLFDRFGKRVNPVSLMDGTTYNLNQTAYDAVEPISITSSFASKIKMLFIFQCYMGLASCRLQQQFRT